MNSRPLVSVIMIFLNGDPFMGEAVESIFAQTYPYWELLLVDDGSTDSSTALARQLVFEHPGKVGYLEHDGHQNRGMSASRNLGIQHARGEFIAFLDADDVWLPQKLEEQVEILDAHPGAAMVYGKTLIWHSWTGRRGDLSRDHTLDLGIQPGRLVQPPSLFFILLQNKFQTPTTCNAMVRRDACLEVNGFVESFQDMYEDQVFFSKILLKKPAYVAENCWARYRQRPSRRRFFAGVDLGYCSDRMPFLHWLSQHLQSEGLAQGTEIWQALQREVRLCRFPFLLFLWHASWIPIEQGKKLIQQVSKRIKAPATSG